MPDPSPQYTDSATLMEKSLAGITEFFRSREQKSGGFSAGRFMPATVEDTYHAIRCLKAARNFHTDSVSDIWKYAGAAPIEAHLDFLMTRINEKWNNSKRLYQLLYSLNVLIDTHISAINPLCSDELIIEFLHTRIRVMPVLDECFHAARIIRLLTDAKKATLDNIPVLTTFPVKSISELRMLLYLSSVLSCALEEHDLNRWREWLRLCRNGDGGYGFFPGTTSYVENIYHALEAFRLLGTAPEDTGTTAGFIRACRSARGGFGRRCEGIPFPDSTWYAVAVLINLAVETTMIARE